MNTTTSAAEVATAAAVILTAMGEGTKLSTASRDAFEAAHARLGTDRARAIVDAAYRRVNALGSTL